MLATIAEEVKKIGRSPAKVRKVFRLRQWQKFLTILFFNARAGNRWQAASGTSGLKQRQYSSYDVYVRHQQSKFRFLDLSDYDVNYRRLLKERLQEAPFVRKGLNVLCLAARLGTEVKAFHDLGCFAVGIDLNPGQSNPFVLPGDFHQVQFPSESVDIIFTNSFDHAFAPEKLMGEIKRLLKPEGIFVTEAIHGEAQNIPPDNYASFWWQHVEDLVAFVAKHGFQPVRRLPFDQPWPGEQIAFEKQK